MSEKILCVDDELNILDAYKRVLKREFSIDTATSGKQGLEVIKEKGPFAAVVSDMRMPEMDGVQFLSKVKVLAPDTVRIMLTGNADQQTAMEAVNEGSVFRFLTKPCSPENLAETLRDAIAQHRLIRAEKDLLENTLQGSVQVLTDILSVVNPTAFGMASRVRRIVNKMATHLQVENAWEIELGAMLSQIGCISLPEETLTKVYTGKQLSQEELQMFQHHPKVGHDLIVRIPRLEKVAEIIAYQEKRFNGEGAPSDHIKGEQIPLGARILKIVLDYDRLMRSRLPKNEAFVVMRGRDSWYDPALLETFITTIKSETPLEQVAVKVDELQTHMILAEDVISHNGLMLVAKGQEVNFSLQMRLHNFVVRGVIAPHIQVLIPCKEEHHETENP